MIDVTDRTENGELIERVRTRAYFLWENRTGTVWWNAESNWREAEQLEALPEVVIPVQPSREMLIADTEDELLTVVESLRRRYPTGLLLFRGQTGLYPSIRSGRARPNVAVQEAVDLAWVTIADYIVGDGGGGAVEYSKAILQHYGLPTHFVDLTSSPRIAGWFATNKYSQERQLFVGTVMRAYTRVRYEPLTEEAGFVLVMHLPDPGALIAANMLFDLSQLPSSCARPHAQSGWLLYDHPPVLPQPNDFWVATIRLPIASYKSSLTPAEVFPSPDRDTAYARLLAAPYVQATDAARRRTDLAFRALDVPEQPTDEDWIRRHKWCDLTVYEPLPMQLWFEWHFKLGNVHPGVVGDIADATKIVVSPGAMEALVAAVDAGAPLGWPELGTNNLLFTFAAIDHDKVIDHSPPYYGVWLFRDHDLLIEHPMVCDEDEKFAVCPGHGFRMRRTSVVLQPIVGSCTCDSPESHEARVVPMLAIGELLRSRELILVPHPRGVPRCYFAFHPTCDFDQDLLLRMMGTGHATREDTEGAETAAQSGPAPDG